MNGYHIEIDFDDNKNRDSVNVVKLDPSDKYLPELVAGKNGFLNIQAAGYGRVTPEEAELIVEGYQKAIEVCETYR